MTKKTVHTVYGIVLSVSAVIAGICLMVACYGIYTSGDKPFTHQSVAAAFSQIAVPVYICLALVIGGFILDIFLPSEKEKRKVQKQYPLILANLHKKADLDLCEGKLRTAILAEQKKRKTQLFISLGILAACSVVFLVYALIPSHFHQSEINTSMVNAMWWLLPCLAIPFGYAVFAAYYSNKSIQKEIELVKLAPRAVGAKPAPAPGKKSVLPCLRWGLLAVGIAILVYGYFAGGTADVMTKAINICTECVGLG